MQPDSRLSLIEERYSRREGSALLTGVQSLVRLVLVQADLDRQAGLRTAGFVSGYRGSPLGTLDLAFGTADAITKAAGIVIRPGVNEEMAATAIAGTQQLAQTPGAKVDGVFALWYGKGPGLDRASDAIRHGNMQGASPKGGVVLAVGDDHLAKSSSIVCNSDEVSAALSVPLFYPATAGEVIHYGLHGFAFSRHTGSWAALKIVPEVADATHTVRADEMAFAPILPALAASANGVYARWPEMPLEQEARLREIRLPAVHNYVRANGLDVAHGRTPGSRLGIVAAGKTWLDLQEAFHLLGFTPERLRALGIALYKPAMIWPLEPQAISEFALGLEALIVVEEKGGFIEQQIKTLLYGAQRAPIVQGKFDEGGAPLFRATADLNPEQIALAIGTQITRMFPQANLDERLATFAGNLENANRVASAPMLRKPFFCSGCPHNRSTQLPQGSRALSGIGCHALAAYNRSDHAGFTQMGGEGVPWVGLAPFTNEPHVFANMGDGTYFHSGILAIRQAVAARVNICYKLLYNSAVAMTGGQNVDGDLDVGRLIDQIRAEGVSVIGVATDDLQRYTGNKALRGKVQCIVHRDELESLQRDFRSRPGVSVIVYDQMCATEKRRLRKRGKLPDPSARVFINELVCEGCGDCSKQSNCLSIEPVRTSFGTKRGINQSSCNKDYSCINGFCPSFVTVDGGKPKRTEINTAELPRLPPLRHQMPTHQRILVAGIGGTGVVTVGALLSESAHLAGITAGVLDQVGMAQKGGAVLSHIHLAQDAIAALRIPHGQADLVLACDELVANSKDVIVAISAGRTKAVINLDVAITGDFTTNSEAIPDGALLTRRIHDRIGDENFAAHPFSRLSENLLGDAIGANMMMVGFAYQKGWLTFDIDALQQAIALNGAAVTLNKSAVDWGRQLATNPEIVYSSARLIDKDGDETIEEMIDRRVAFLSDYQDAAYAARFKSLIDKVRLAEAPLNQGAQLASAAVQSLFKLMAYKDEYEVARLYTDGKFEKALAEQFEGKTKLTFHFAPPVLAKADRATSHIKKRSVGAWILPVLRLIARLRFLRGTPFDPFGYGADRRTERALVRQFEDVLGQICRAISSQNLAQAIHIAKLPQSVRGFGYVKERAADEYQQKLRIALMEFSRAGASRTTSTQGLPDDPAAGQPPALGGHPNSQRAVI